MDTRRFDPPQDDSQNNGSPPQENALYVSQEAGVSQPLQSRPPDISETPQPNLQGQNVVFSPAAQPDQPNTTAPGQLPPPPPPPSGNIPPTSPPNQPPPTLMEEDHSRFPMLVKIGVGFVVLLVVIFILFAFIISRFSGGSKASKVTLQWWGLWEDPAVMQTLITQFQQSHSNITVQYIKQDPKQYSERLLTRIQNGNGPDIFRYHNSWMPMVQYFLSPLSNDAITKQDFTKNYYPVIQQDLVKNGAIYGIPLEIDTLALFTNSQLFQSTGLKPPTNWTDFITAARALTVPDRATGKIKTAGAALGTFDNITHAPDIVSLLLFQNNADLTNLSQTKQNVSDALLFYTKFAQNTDNTAVWDGDQEQSINAFAKGNLAMYFGYSYDIFNIKSLNPNLAFAVTSVPHLLGRNVTVASYWVEGVSNKSKHQKEAMQFMNFLSQKETEQQLYSQEAKTRIFGEPYARIDLADSLKNDPLAYPFLQQAKNANSSFFAGETYDTGINAQMNGYLGNAVRSILSNSSPQSVVDPLILGVSQVLNQYAPKK